MERCDFSSIMSIIRTYISDAHEMNQVDFLYLLFDSYLRDEDNQEFYFDNGLVCRWLNGLAKISPKISGYFLDAGNQTGLAQNIEKNIIPLMFDSSMAAQKLYELIIQDISISERKKQELIQKYPCGSSAEEAAFISSVLCFGMSRDFVKRDSRVKALISAGNLSPALGSYVIGNDVPLPCRYFCGRDAEMKQLHDMLLNHGKVFVQGIAGIGKSELAKAYAKQYRKEYTNILYLTYSGDLKQDISELDFADDLPGDNDEERFRKHNRFMRSLKPDTLLIVDNFNTIAIKDALLPVLMKYRCQILFTTRSRFDSYPSMQLTEISDATVLISLMGNYYSGANEHQFELEQIIGIVHGHTLAVELAARLLEHGILEPEELLSKLREEKIALDDSDQISIIKDGVSRRGTYYGHIHLLFSLYLLSEEQLGIMRNMALFPITGIPIRRLAEWLSLKNLNIINDLIETGLILPQPGRVVSLHPMIQEITIADEKPSVTNCRILCENLRSICLMHGIDLPYYKLLFGTIENIITLAAKDDLPYYLKLLQDAFPCMEIYRHEDGMQTIISEMQNLLSDQAFGTSSDRALLLDFRAGLEKKSEKAIRLEKDALALCTEITRENAHLTANIHANLGAYYQKLRQTSLARQHMEAGIMILEQYQLTYMHDSIQQISNYAVLLTDLGEPDRAMTAMMKLARTVKEYHSDQCGDYAAIQEITGSICLAAGQIKQATTYFKQAMQIYETIWANEPERIEQKYQEIGSMYPKAGIGLAQKYLSSLK